MQHLEGGDDDDGGDEEEDAASATMDVLPSPPPAAARPPARRAHACGANGKVSAALEAEVAQIKSKAQRQFSIVRAECRLSPSPTLLDSVKLGLAVCSSVLSMPSATAG